VSDNGLNFRGGEAELRALWSKLDQDEIREKNPTIEWWFHAPASPNMNGAIESMIKCCKRAINTIIPDGTLRDEELSTIFAMAENIVNARPISYISNDVGDPEPLTPAHFLRGKGFQQLASLPANEEWPLTRRWFRMQRLLDEFWRRYVREITPHMNRLNKWVKEEKDLVVGDVVVIFENKNARGIYPLGKIVKIHRNPRDQRVRTVEVLCGGKTYLRSLNKIMFLMPSTQ